MMVNILFHRDRRDFSEMFLHHIVTIVLILFSYTVNFLPVGSVIMLIMDFSDIFVAVFKMAVDVQDTIQNFFFFLMLATWIYFRMYFFPV